MIRCYTIRYNARIDSDSILAFLCVRFLYLMAKKMLKKIVSHELTQRKALHHIVNQP